MSLSSPKPAINRTPGSINSPLNVPSSILPSSGNANSSSSTENPLSTSQPEPPHQPIAGPSRLPPPSSSTPNVTPSFANLNGLGPSHDASSLQARLQNAQQAMQATMEQQQQRQQAREKAQQANNQPSPIPQLNGQERKLSGNPADWTSMASTMGGMMNMQGADKEAIMKQLAALQQSQAQRARLANSGSTPPQTNGSQANQSPATGNAPSPLNSAGTQPVRPPPTGPSTTQLNSTPLPVDPSTASQAPTPQAGQLPGNGPALPTGPAGIPNMIPNDQQRNFMMVQQEKMKAAQQYKLQQQGGLGGTLPPPGSQQTPAPVPPSTRPQPQESLPVRPIPPAIRPPLSTAAGSPSPNPSAPTFARPPDVNSRRAFLNSLAAFHKANNIPLPAEIFNGEKDGFVKIGDRWVEVVDIFMLVVRNGGIMKVTQLPPDSPVWQHFLQTNNLPNPLPSPIPMPKQRHVSADAAPQMTNSPIHFICAGYFAWMATFEQHWTKQKTMAAAKQAQAMRGQVAATQSPIAPTDTSSTTSLTTPTAGSPAQPTQPSPVQIGAPGLSSDPSLSSANPAQAFPAGPQSGTGSGTSSDDGSRSRPGSSKGKTRAPEAVSIPPIPTAKPLPSHISTGSSPAPSPIGQPDSAGVRKRRRDKRADTLSGSTGESSPTTPTSASTPSMVSGPQPPAAIAEPQMSPKRARYKVEYRPLSHPISNLGGWDERAVSSTFPKNNLKRSSRSVHELSVVDMDAILMGLRSRMPHQLGYALTVLSMLSMPHPEEQVGGLPLHHLSEVYLEVIELIEEATFGDDGYEAWFSTIGTDETEMEKRGSRKDADPYFGIDVNKIKYAEIERLGHAFDISLDEIDGEIDEGRRDQTGGSTEIVLAGLNILRNFSMLPDNQRQMARFPELFILLSRISDARLCRFPGALVNCHRPYSILELARVRRDCVVILTNVGTFIDLRAVPTQSTLSIFRMISTFLNGGWETIRQKPSETLYGPPISPREIPPYVQLTLMRALEAFTKLSLNDYNREVLSSIPPEELVELFENLVKLLPMTPRSLEAMHSIEDCLGYTECLALALYSLVFLSPTNVRTSMRQIPGTVGIFTRLIFDTLPPRPNGVVSNDNKISNPFGILARRLCETLGVLNGEVDPAGRIGNVGFGAGAGGGLGWRFGNGSEGMIEKGWLAFEEERVLGCMASRGIDLTAFRELDALWWAGMGESGG